ncbi:NADPH-dependent F420 reductase [soil metagenome]
MTAVTIIGAGNMGGAIARIATAGSNDVQVIVRDVTSVEGGTVTVAPYGAAITGDIVVLALPQAALADILATYADQLVGKTVVDITNPVDFATFDSLVVPVGSSQAQELATALPQSHVLKAFNTNFAATLASGTVGGEKTVVLIAGDDTDAKVALAAVVQGGGLKAIDAGSLKRAHELEALGFLQMTLAAAEKTSWTSGFALAE